MKPPEAITCVECGADAKLMSYLPEDGEVEAGTPLAYRCTECTERFDVVMSEDPE